MSELTLNSLEKDSMIKIIDDYKPSLEKLQEMVGGNIEVLTLNNGDTRNITRFYRTIVTWDLFGFKKKLY